MYIILEQCSLASLDAELFQGQHHRIEDDLIFFGFIAFKVGNAFNFFLFWGIEKCPPVAEFQFLYPVLFHFVSECHEMNVFVHLEKKLILL